MIVISGQSLTPCQCYRPMLGGLDRATEFLTTIAAASKTLGAPTLTVAVGDSFGAFPDSAAPDSQVAQWTEKARIAARAFARAGAVAVVPSPATLDAPCAVLLSLRREAEAPFLLVNPPAALAAACVPFLDLSDGQHIRALAVAWDPKSDYDELRDPWPLLRAALVRSDSIRLTVVFLLTRNVRPNEVSATVKSTKGVDAWILSPDASKPFTMQTTVSDGQPFPYVLQLRSTKGQYVDWADFYVAGDSRRTHDGSKLALYQEVARRSRHARGGMASSEFEQWFMEAAQSLAREGNLALHFREEIHEGLGRDPDTQKSIDGYGEWVMREFAPQDREGGMAHVRSVSRPYVGSESCAPCHEPQFAAWSRSRHGNAMATLDTARRKYDYSCFPCHSTGYLQEPRVRDLAALRLLSNVGCESCHGPGDVHIQSPASAPMLKAQAATCASCHDAAHSPSFSFPEFLPRVECIQARGDRNK